MKKLFWSAVALFILVCVVFLVKLGIQPRDIQIMKASFFDRYEEVGAVVFRSLYPRLELEPVVVWGVQPDSEAHIKVLEGFIWVA